MANKNINNLPTATVANTGDKLEILQGGTNKQIDVSLLVSQSTPLGLIQIIDLDGDFFTDLATASAYIRGHFSSDPGITNESFDNGVYYCTVPRGTIMNTGASFMNNNYATTASFIDEFGLIAGFYSSYTFYKSNGNHRLGKVIFSGYDFEEFSGTVEIAFLEDISYPFAENSTGKFIINGNIGAIPSGNSYAGFFLTSTATILVNKEQYTINAGAIQGDLQTAIANGCNVQFDGINLATVNDISGLASINSPIFTGTPLAPNAALFDATTQIATTKWVRDNAGGCLYRNNTGGTSVTGVTTQQLVDEHLIAGSVMEAGWDLLNEIYINKNLDNGTVTLRVLYNSTNSLSGATTLATYTSTTNNNQASFIRNFGVISPTVTELFLHPTTNAAGDFIATSNVPVTQLNIDWTQPIYILWSIQNSSILDTSVISRNKLWKK